MGEQIALAGFQGLIKMKAAQAQAGGLMGQATQRRVESKMESLKYKQQGVAVLDNILQTQAAINARAMAGNVSASSGSAAKLAMVALSKGISEKYVTEDNQLVSILGGEMQAREYERSAKSTMQAGLLDAAFGIAEAQLAPKIGGPTTETG